MQIIRGIRAVGDRILISGLPGAGKTRFAAGARSPLFIDAERGTSELDVARVEPRTFREIMAILAAWPMEFRTCVIDTLDAVQRLVWEEVGGGKSIAEARGGYGKGYSAAAGLIASMLTALDALSRQGIEIIICCHVKAEEAPNPVGGDVLRYELAVHKDVRALVFGWSSVAAYAEATSNADENGKVHATGTRRLRFKHPALPCKIREIGGGATFPEEMPLDYAAFASARRGDETKLDALAEEAVALANALGGEELPNRLAGIARARASSDPGKLAAWIKTLTKKEPTA